jgi:F0F1-type ATP synthase membrane subunit b/b'
MDVNIIQQLIATVGFPIVCVMALGWFIYKAFEKFTAQSEQREEKLYTIIADAQTTNEKLLQTNAEFVSVLNTYKSDLEEIKSDVSEIKERLN